MGVGVVITRRIASVIWIRGSDILMWTKSLELPQPLSLPLPLMCLLSQQLLHHVAGLDAGEAEVQAGVTEGEALVVDA